jgi:hypothetical protein
LSERLNVGTRCERGGSRHVGEVAECRCRRLIRVVT